MRLWSIHPRYLDAKGLVALWREGLLAQKVLQGQTRGYTHHPQLIRFRATGNPQGAIASYLRHVVIEAQSRGYSFDSDKISARRIQSLLPVTEGQIEYEYHHLVKKLKQRAPEVYDRLPPLPEIEVHPLFEPCPGGVESWEII